MKPANNRVVSSVLAVLTCFSLLSGAALLFQRQVQIRGVLDGFPALDTPPRVPILGVNVELTRYSDDQILSEMSDIADRGFSWVRQSFDWALIEPSPGIYDWTRADLMIDAITHHNLDVVAVLEGSPAWAASEVGLPPVSMQDFAAFASAFATRYGDKIRVYQIWDEPNLASGWDTLAADPVAYATMLEAAYSAIHAADNDAYVLTAGLAPTIEKGPANLSDIVFLEELYANGAESFFDGVAGKPYGFNTGPYDRSCHENSLNFSRFLLLREVMERNGDSAKQLWASHFGWNSLPSGWQGAPSIWGSVDADMQSSYTLDAYQRALEEWPWTGALILENWQPDAPADDPVWGFALRNSDGSQTPTARSIAERAESVNATLWPGIYNPANPLLDYTGDWEFSELGADFSESGGSIVEVPFTGDMLGMIARRGNYRAHVYVDVDGMPSHILPADSTGRAYLILTDYDYQPRVEILALAEGSGETRQLATIEADRGWDQWALVGFAVGNDSPTAGYDLGIAALLLIAIVSFSLNRYHADRSGGPVALDRLALWVKAKLSSGVHLFLTLVAGFSVWLSMAITWGGLVPDLLRRIGDGPSLLLTAVTAGVFYFSPWLFLTLLSLLILFILIYARPHTGLAVLMFFTPYIFFPRPLFDRALSMVELISLILLAVWLISSAARFKAQGWPSVKAIWDGTNSLDRALLAFLLIGIISISWAKLVGVAITDLRQMMIEPLVVYLVLRTMPFSPEERWQIVDMFVLTGAITAVIGFYQAITGVDLITAEGGSHRLKSVFGTPNNAALFFDRVIPISAAVAVIRGALPRRRWLYGFSALVMTAAAALTLSKGSILLGLPAGLGLVLILWLGKTGGYILIAAIVLLGVSLIPLSRLPRFASLFDLSEGSSFFRLKLWRSTFQLLKDQPITGVGLDQFLYAYRGHYIQPEAWQQPDLSQPHNFLLNYWARLGIFGLAIGIWIQAAFWRMAVRLKDYYQSTKISGQWPLVAGLMGSIAAMVAHGMVDETHFVIELAFIFSLTLGIISSYFNESEMRDVEPGSD